MSCPICEKPLDPKGNVWSPYSLRDFQLGRCAACGFARIVDPRTDFATLYGEQYYCGLGADTLVDYARELVDSETVRFYEWRGVSRAVNTLMNGRRELAWLDYGCGLGGLVRHLRSTGSTTVFGFEEGYAAEQLSAHGLPSIDRSEFPDRAGTFDVVTAIEVLEHVIDPLEPLREIAELLRPGGVLFLTTGNAARHRHALQRWSYVLPDVHVSFFEPATMAKAMSLVGLDPQTHRWLPGYDDIIRYKVLKNLKVHQRRRWERAIPWSIVARGIKIATGLLAHPVGVKLA